MDDAIRNVAWAIAEAWWRKNHRRAAGTVPEATSSGEYADNFWQGWTEEARAALEATHRIEAAAPPIVTGPPHAHY